MFLGNNKINDMFIGTTPITSVWLGAYKVWERNPEWTYVIDNISVNYLPTSQGEILRPNASNYASVVGRIAMYKNGVLQDTKPVMQLGLTTTSPYVKIVNDRVYFNIDQYGTTNMTNSNPFGVTDIYYNFSGTTGSAPTIYVEPNRIASTATTSFNCNAVLSVDFLNYNETTFVVTNRNTGIVQTTYTSGKSNSAGKNLDGYLYKVDRSTGTNTLLSTMSYNGTYTVTVGPVNQATYPQIYIYRLSYMAGTTGVDDFIYIMQKGKNNTTGLQLYYGANKVDGWNVETSGMFYLANNSHTSSTTYDIECDNSYITITEINGIFIVEATSSDSGRVTITDNSGNSCEFEINM